MAVSNIRSSWDSGHLRFKAYTSSLATTPYVSFGQTDYPLQVKIHNRPATTGNSLEVRARPSSATAEHFAVDSTLDWRPTGDTATGGGVRAVQGVARMDAGYTVAGGDLCGVYGQVALNATATANSASTFMSALYGLIEDGGTYTAVGHLNTLWLDSHLTKTVTAGATEFAYITNNGSTTFDNVFYIYAGNKITNLFTIDTASGLVGDKASGDYTFTATRKVKVKVGGETGYIVVDIS